MTLPALALGDLRPGSIRWLRSPVRLWVTRVLMVVYVMVAGVVLVASLASWPHDFVILDPEMVAFGGWAAGLTGLLWIAANTLRLLPVEQKWIYNPYNRRNLAVSLMMLGIVRPTARSLAAVAGCVAAAALVILGGTHFGVADIGTRVHAGLTQIDPDKTGSWTTVTATAYRHARGAAVRDAASFGIVPAASALLSCLGQLRLRVASPPGDERVCRTDG